MHPRYFRDATPRDRTSIVRCRGDPGNLAGVGRQRRRHRQVHPIAYGLNYAPQTPGFAADQYRTRVNDAVFDGANPAALRILMQQYDVRFLFIDRLHHNANPALLNLGRVVFSDNDATILAVS
jgi:hypothetical protein